MMRERVAAMIVLSTLGLCAAAAAQKAPDPARVAEIAAMLPESPAGLGRPISDRAAWEALGATEAYSGVVARAEALLTEPIPEQPDELYLEFSRTGNRTNWQRVANQRRGRVAPLTLAECIENKGRFIAALEAVIRALCAERTWIMPAHDRNLRNFNGEMVDVDLGSSHLAWELATADYLLGDRLSAEVRQLLRERIEERIFRSYRNTLEGDSALNWWITTTNNWNAVCHAGVVGTALAMAESREERAYIVAGAEANIPRFLSGFTSDGYCSEGLGYWNYGFGHFILLAETVCQATGGQVDLFEMDGARAPALFGARIEIANGVYPAFADCAVSASPAWRYMRFLNDRYTLGLAGYDSGDTVTADAGLAESLLFSFPNSATRAGASPAGATARELRTWFEDAGVLIGRPDGDSNCRLAVAMKGGHNAEHHNHNDVGSYVVVIGDRAVLLDPGAEVYTARTFSSRRYESKLLNSFGHPVPMVAGQLQRSGSEARGEVLATRFTDTEDLLRLNLRSCYAVETLAKLERTFRYSRAGEGSLSVTDEVEFTAPEAFGTAIIVRGSWRQASPGELLVYDGEQAARVEIGAEGGTGALTEERIEEDAAVKPLRIGISFTEPVTAGAITLRITPLSPEGAGALLRNGGFEHIGWCWSIPEDGVAEVSGARAHTGERSLHIVDASKERGSDVTSARVPVEPAARYVLRGAVLPVSGSGIGMYVRFYDAEGRSLTKADEKGNIAPLDTRPDTPGDWAGFEYPFETPPDAVALDVWIHSYSGAGVEAYLDDLGIAEG